MGVILGDDKNHFKDSYLKTSIIERTQFITIFFLSITLSSFHAENMMILVLFLNILHLEVIWYSWSSNWGGDFYGGVRISLPDPASSSVVQGYIQYPNGTLAVDYPEVVLVKLIKKTLFEIPGDVKKRFFWSPRIFFLVNPFFFLGHLHVSQVYQAKRWGRRISESSSQTPKFAG